VNTMLAHHEAYGYLPIWTAWGQENYCMIGNHSIPVIVDAYLKGFNGFDPEEALQAMITSTTENHLNSNWDLYNRYGYYPIDSLDNEAVSRTLESGYDDFCIAIMAESMNKTGIAEEYFRRAAYYKNLFDSETGLMRGKDSKGNFRTPFDPLVATSPMNNPGDYTEANAWQYTWTPAQHDVEGYMELLGGTSDFTRLLDTFFSLEGTGDDKHLGQEGLIGQYAHGNEPSHHIAYLYAWSDTPESGRKYITQIYNQFYDDTPQGITGNEDCGQMSAWYIFTTLGFYPVNPAGGEFIFGVPQVKRATIKLENDNFFEIIHKPDKDNELTVHFNEQELNKRITFSQIMNGGRLTFR
ncbi:MAG: glycoside hydrolase family 92 protein, partial [Calditrichota bacterium]